MAWRSSSSRHLAARIGVAPTSISRSTALTYIANIGKIVAPAIQGLLTANCASYASSNPDTTNTLSVDCTESLSTPSPVTNADAEAYRTLSCVYAQPTLTGGIYVMPTSVELCAFGDVTTTSTYAADLTYLERDFYGTTWHIIAFDRRLQFTLI